MELYQTFLEKGSCSITDSVIDHNINIPKYNRLAGSSYIQITIFKILMIMNALNGV